MSLNQPKSNASFTSRKMDWLDAASYDRRLKPIDFEVAFVLIQHANKHSAKAWPSQEAIADRVGVSMPTVKRSIRVLRETGWIERRTARGTDGKRHNIYTVLFGNVQTMFDAMAEAKMNRRYWLKYGDDVDAEQIIPDTSERITPDPLTPSRRTPSKRRVTKNRGVSESEVISESERSLSQGACNEKLPAPKPRTVYEELLAKMSVSYAPDRPRSGR